MGQDSEQDELLSKVSRRLDQAGIPSMLTGELALALYGQAGIVRNLLRNLPGLDFAYVEKWAHTLGA